MIFSSWSMVPDAIAAILSYEAERRMGVGEAGQRYFGQPRQQDLLEYLHSLLGTDTASADLAGLQIRLEP